MTKPIRIGGASGPAGVALVAMLGGALVTRVLCSAEDAVLVIVFGLILAVQLGSLLALHVTARSRPSPLPRPFRAALLTTEIFTSLTVLDALHAFAERS
jgi:hypothetical protein